MPRQCSVRPSDRVAKEEAHDLRHQFRLRATAPLLSALLLTVPIVVMSANPGAAAAKKGTIGVILMAEDNPFFVALGHGVTAQAAKYGYTTNVQNGNYSDATQLTEMETLVNAGVKGVVFEPYENVPSETAIKYASAHGVPVVTADSPSSSKLVKSFVATNNYAAGQQIGRWFSKKIHFKGPIAILNSQASGTVTARVDGFMSAIKKHPAIKVVATANGLGQRPQSLSAMETILQAHSNIVGVFAINDPSALGAYAALKADHLQSKVVVGSIDGSPAFVNLVKRDPLAAVAAQKPNYIGALAMRYLQEVIQGKKPPKQFLIPPQLVDYQNWKSYKEWH